MTGPETQDDQTKLPTTPRKESRAGDKAVSTFTVAQRWFAEQRLKAVLVAIAIASPLLSLKCQRDTVESIKSSTWVYNTDANGVTIFAPVEMADPDSKIFREICIQAAEVYLKRNPAGLSNPELLPRFFTDSGAKAVGVEVGRLADERNRRNLFDQPEFVRLPERLDASSGALRYRLTGYIVRSGVIDGLPQRDVGDFTMAVELTPNPGIKEKGRYPYQINQYKMKVVWRSNKREESYSSSGSK